MAPKKDDGIAAALTQVLGQALAPVISALSKAEAVWEQRLLSEKAIKEVPTTVIVTRQFKLNMTKEDGTVEAVWKDPELKEETISIHRYITQPAVVGVELGSTLNMGNYEAARILVHLTVPCYREEVDGAYVWAKDFVEERYKKEVAEARTVASALKKDSPF